MNDRRRDQRRKTAKPSAAERRNFDRRHGDRREAVRAPLDLWVEEERGDELYFRRTGNLSMGGVYFEQTIPHALGTKVRVRFTLPGDPAVIEAVGEVVNTPKVKDGLGMGLSFVSMSDNDRVRLEHFVNTAAIDE